jgi:hypothetical protein
MLGSIKLAGITMRELKFRVWDKQNKEWLQADFWFVRSSESVLVIHPPTQGAEDISVKMETLGPDRVSVTQYTGLKDSNGVEIFEGDILDCPSPFMGIAGGYTTVAYISGCFDPFGYDQLAADPTDCKVLGNVYENPELSQTAATTPKDDQSSNGFNPTLEA